MPNVDLERHLTREDLVYLRERLCEMMSEYFKLHSRLLNVADPISCEINCSLIDLAKKINYDHRVLYYFLTALETFRFVKFENSRDYSEKIKIKILVKY